MGRWAKGVGNVERNGAGGGGLLGAVLEVATTGLDGGGEGDGEYIDDKVSEPVELKCMAERCEVGEGGGNKSQGESPG